MRKAFLSLALTLALCLSLAVPAFAVEPSDYSDNYYHVTNVLEHRELTPGDVFTCVAPTRIKLAEYDRTVSKLTIGAVKLLDSTAVTEDTYWDYDYYTEGGSKTVTREGVTSEGDESITLTQPGTYIVIVDEEFLDGDGGGYSALLFYVQNNEMDPNPTKPGTTDPTTTTPSTPSFTDVKSGDWFYEAVQWAVEEEITNGTTATTFSPKQDCTVAHILTFLWRASGSPEPTKDNPFTDVKDGDWFADAAVWASEKGMVTGNTFNPNAPCTRSMAVTYMWQAAGSPEAEAASFTDVPASADYAKAVAWAVENGVTDGTSATTFSPDTVCTRGHIVTFLYRGFGE